MMKFLPVKEQVKRCKITWWCLGETLPVRVIFFLSSGNKGN